MCHVCDLLNKSLDLIHFPKKTEPSRAHEDAQGRVTRVRQGRVCVLTSASELGYPLPRHTHTHTHPTQTEALTSDL